MRTKGRRAQDTKIECVRNILDLQFVIDYAYKDAFVKVANVKSERKCSQGGEGREERRSQEPTRTPACTELYRRGRGGDV